MRISILIDLEKSKIEELGLTDLFPNFVWMWDRKSSIRSIVFQELTDILGQRKVKWRTDSQREYHKDRFLHIYVPDDDWMVTAKLKDAIVAKLQRQTAILEKYDDPIPLHSDENRPG